MKKLLLLVVALLALSSAFGCAYSGATWNTKNGKMYVTKNDLLLYGIMRGMYECTPAGTSFNCQAVPDAP